mgnify:CR=1 FL=1
MTEGELRAAEKKTRKEQLLNAVLMGFMVGVLAFGVATQGFRLVPILFPSAMIYVFYRMSRKTDQRMTEIRAELERKRSQ